MNELNLNSQYDLQGAESCLPVSPLILSLNTEPSTHQPFSIYFRSLKNMLFLSTGIYACYSLAWNVLSNYPSPEQLLLILEGSILLFFSPDLSPVLLCTPSELGTPLRYCPRTLTSSIMTIQIFLELFGQ